MRPGRWVFKARAFGDDLRAARERRDLSGEDVALELDLTTNAVYRVELADGPQRLRIEVVLALATFYSLDIQSYFELVAERENHG